jgi:hypothetical protein
MNLLSLLELLDRSRGEETRAEKVFIPKITYGRL